MTIEFIRSLCKQDAVRWTNHIAVRMIQRGIRTEEILHVLMHGEIIEQYPTDYPYPSCLMIGTLYEGRPIHVVCGANEQELWMITAYIPNAMEWDTDYHIRKEV